MITEQPKQLRRKRFQSWLYFPVFALLLFCLSADFSSRPANAISIGSRLELFVDDFLIEKMDGLDLLLHHPVAREVAIVFDRPWEGNTSAYVTVFRDGDLCRMYYRASNYDLQSATYGSEAVCYAESRDGIHWVRPELGLFSFNGSTKNNIVWQGPGAHNFAPFKDSNPACPADEKYKAVASERDKLYAFKSGDGIRWSILQEEPILSGSPFDSLNLAFWDPVRGKYLEFHRDWRDGIRDIMTSSSPDFRTWAKPIWLDYGETPAEHLYTNSITPYFRAPHILIGFPMRFVPDRQVGWHKIAGVSDGLFMSSRDGTRWKRWGEAFLRPGLQKERWVNRNNMIAWGILQTASSLPGAPDEISIYSSEGYYVEDCRMRRHTLRLDGFVSVHAGGQSGEMLTKPLVFRGERLVLNVSTSAAGKVLVELQDEDGVPVRGFALADCQEIYGDEIERTVEWKGRQDLSGLAGKTVRLRFLLKDADLYSLRFCSAIAPSPGSGMTETTRLLPKSHNGYDSRFSGLFER